MIPDGVTSVKPRPLPGWTITIKTRPLNPPITSHGKVINTTVDAISWSGNTLLDEYFEDFGISMKLPDAPDNTDLYFKTIQDCQVGSIGWVQIPGQAGTLEYPAAKLTLKANGTLINASTGSALGATNSAVSSVSNISMMLAGFLGLFVF